MKPSRITAKGDTKQVRQFKKGFSFIVQTEYDFSDWVPIFSQLTCMQNLVSVRNKACRKYIEELRYPFIAKHKQGDQQVKIKAL